MGAGERKKAMRTWRLTTAAGGLAVGLFLVWPTGAQAQDLQTLLAYFLRDLAAGTLGATAPLTSVTTADLTVTGTCTGCGASDPLVVSTIKGGTGTTSTLSLMPTSGVGTTGADIVFKVGTNGGTEAGRVLNSGTFAWGTAGQFTVGTTGAISTVPNISMSDAGYLAFGARSYVTSPVNGKVQFHQSIDTGTLTMQFGGAPVCSTNCGTSPTVTGTDTFMTVLLGTTPASGFLLTFNGTWAAAPSCVGSMAKAGMVVGKDVLTAVTTTTTLTVVTNGTAPSTGDIYHFHCGGLS
jgi:hypothetical protein